MIRIVGVQRNTDPDLEFVLLQNQGSLRVHLRGHAIVGEIALHPSATGESVHLFADDVDVQPGMYVLLRSGVGEPHWTRTRDGSTVYCAYMRRSKGGVWDLYNGPIHVLGPQHSFVMRRTEPVQTF